MSTDKAIENHDAGPLLGLGLSEGLGLPPEREAFERWASQDGRWANAVERSGNGYKLMSTHAAWMTWQACWPLARAAIYSAEQAQIEAPLRIEIERLRAEVKALRELWDEAEAGNDAMRAVNRARLLGA